MLQRPASRSAERTWHHRSQSIAAHVRIHNAIDANIPEHRQQPTAARNHYCEIIRPVHSNLFLNTNRDGPWTLMEDCGSIIEIIGLQRCANTNNEHTARSVSFLAFQCWIMHYNYSKSVDGNCGSFKRSARICLKAVQNYFVNSRLMYWSINDATVIVCAAGMRAPKRNTQQNPSTRYFMSKWLRLGTVWRQNIRPAF